MALIFKKALRFEILSIPIFVAITTMFINFAWQKSLRSLFNFTKHDAYSQLLLPILITYRTGSLLVSLETFVHSWYHAFRWGPQKPILLVLQPIHLVLTVTYFSKIVLYAFWRFSHRQSFWCRNRNHYVSRLIRDIIHYCSVFEWYMFQKVEYKNPFVSFSCSVLMQLWKQIETHQLAWGFIRKGMVRSIALFFVLPFKIRSLTLKYFIMCIM